MKVNNEANNKCPSGQHRDKYFVKCASDHNGKVYKNSIVVDCNLAFLFISPAICLNYF